MGPAKKIQDHYQYPYLVKQQDGSGSSLYNIPNIDINGMDHHHQFLKSVECQIMQQNPSSSSSSSTSSSTPVFSHNLGIVPSCSRNTEEIWNSARLANVGDMTLDECIISQGALSSGGVKDQDYGLFSMPKIDHEMVRPLSRVNKDQDHGGLFILPKMDPELVSQWHQHDGMMSMQVEPVESKFSVVENGLMDVEELKTVSDKSPEPHGLENKSIDERMLKTIERRQKRMIKNRESAARSRAKKQAHTNQLEQSKLQLQATNDLLKKRKEVLLLLNSSSTSEPRYQLRRTSSATF